MNTTSRWPVVAAFAGVAAVTQLLWLNFAGVTTVAADHYDVSETAIGWLAQAFPLLYVVLAIPAGAVLDRWFRGGLIAGALLTAVGASVRIIGDDYTTVLVGQVMIAVAQPLVLNAITGVARGYLSEKDRPTGIAIGTASTFAGMLFAFLLTFFFSASEQLTSLVGLSAVLAWVAVGALVLALRGQAPLQAPSPPGPSSSQAIGVRAVWADPFVRRMCMLVTLPFGTFVALTTFAQPLLEPAGVSVDSANIMLMANVVAGVVGCAVVPVVAARRRREVGFIVAGLVAATVSCTALALAPGDVVGLIALVTVGLFLVPALPTVLELTERRAGEAEGMAAGLVWMSGNLGGLVIASAVGLLVDVPGPAFLLAAVATLLGVPVALSLRAYVSGIAKAHEQVPEAVPS